MNKKHSAGGAANASGMEFQHRVAAWVAIHILAEQDAAPLWGLSSETTLEWLQCESEHPVDDLLVGTSANGIIFVQIKRRVELSKAAGSDLASTFDQFVRQFITCRTRNTKKLPWDRPLDPVRDRLLLIISPNSSKRIGIHLSMVLRRLCNLHVDQPLDDAVGNAEERKALEIIQEHIKKSWQKMLGTNPSEKELRQLLSLVRIQVIDMSEGAEGEREARTLLRNTVLLDPNKDEVAWAQLRSLCADLASMRLGVSRGNLQSILLKAALRLKAVRSYRDDIEKLKKYSLTTFNALTQYAQILVGNNIIKIQRPATKILKCAAEAGSILVVGEPGAGKSGSLHELIESSNEVGKDYVFLAVDRLSASSLAELRTEIGLDHELIQVLKNWPGLQSGLLVIDALDAARGDPSAGMIRELICQVIQMKCRWNVVASIRKYDLRNSSEIKTLFAGPSLVEFQDSEFSGVHHLNVPRLLNAELDQIATQSYDLNSLIQSAPQELNDLLRVIFNLRLLAELLGTGVAACELTPIKTQLELLDRYWLVRVIREDRQGDAREGILRTACEKMVETRALRIDRALFNSPENSTQLNDLLSSQVFVEYQPSNHTHPDRYILTYSHNVLFDYAVARLLLRGIIENVVNRFANDPEMAVVVRPSFLLHFRHLWAIDDNHHQFWNLAFRIMLEKQIPEIGKLIGPSVAVELAQILQDLEPLCLAVESSNSANQCAAERLLKHLFGALLAEVMGESRLLGSNAGPWCDLLERVSRNLRFSMAYAIRPILCVICECPESFTSDQRVAAGHTARRLLIFALSQEHRDESLVNHSLQVVCRTFESDSTASAMFIRQCLEPSRIADYGFVEMFLLAREVKRLIAIDYVLVEEIYCAVFGYRETSKAPTPMGQSRILSLISNRQQDYKMALYELEKVFPVFLKQAPINAARALIVVIEAYVTQYHFPASGEWNDEKFDFNGRQVCIRKDHSYIWDEGGTYRHEEPLKMLDAFQRYLERLIETNVDTEILHELVQIIISKNRLAVFWRRILRVGARFPKSLGKEILPLVLSVPILTCVDTTFPAGEFLEAIFLTSSLSEREQIERAILNIPETLSATSRERGELIRNRLLGCLSKIELVTKEAQDVLDQLKERNAVPSNEPPVCFETFHGPYGEEEFLRDQGVPVEAEENRKIREFEQPIREFTDTHHSSTPTLVEASSLLPPLQRLYDVLLNADKDGVHPKQRDHAWGCLTAACARIARIEDLFCDMPLFLFVKTVLLEMSYHDEPIHIPEQDAQFDDHPSWGSPAPRIESAEGLVFLVRNPSYLKTEEIDVIDRLSTDPVPSVRFQIASSLNVLYITVPQLMWRLIERISQKESSRGVLQGLVSGPLRKLAACESDRVSGLTKVIFDRVREGIGSETVREFCVGIFTDLYIWRKISQSGEVILEIAQNISSYPNEAPHLLAHIREPLTFGPVHPRDPEADSVRSRALDLISRILHSARNGIREIERIYSDIPFTKWASKDQESTKTFAQLIDQIASEVYFASGAFDKKGRNQDLPNQTIIFEQAERFYCEAGLILDELADISFPSVTHHLLETLEFFIPSHYREVFIRIGQVVRSGQQGGYQYESLAADLIVKLVERYLAEYRTLLREDDKCQKILIEILDVFVQAGWPKARRLTYRLDEIFR
jgi:hypothetical protein